MTASRRMFLSLAAAVVAASSLSQAMAADPENTLVLTLPAGEVRIALRPDLAPKAVERIKALTRAGEYDNVAFHRVIDGFMAQTGDVTYGDLEDGYDPAQAGFGGSSLPNLPDEFTNTPFLRGTVGLARADFPDSSNSQFFIMYRDGRLRAGDYAVIGEVESGMEAVDALKKGTRANNGMVEGPDRIIRARIAADN